MAVLAFAASAWQPFAAPASAAETVGVELFGRALAPREKPRLVVSANAPVAALVLELRRSDGAVVREATGRLGLGQKRTFVLPQPEGTFQYEGTLLVRLPHEESRSVPLSFEASRLPPPSLVVGPDAVDLSARTLTVTVDRDGGELSLKAVGDEGEVLDERRQAFPEAKAGEVRVVGWHQPEGAVLLRLDVRATDSFGFFRDLELYPWRLEIPHEDVLFETGRSDVLAEERPKIDAAHAELSKALARWGRFATVSLFVAGHTDTVGDAASNQALSEARARAIAGYFRARGVKVPIFYAGLGETRPLVPTPDDTDEPRNRRAEYIVAVQPPDGARWLGLP